MERKNFMERAVELSLKGSSEGKGGPFGAVIVKNGKIIGEAYYQETSTNDKTAHAEVMAIRDACKNLNSFDLTDCEIYTSCEPCPMCLGAIYWSRVVKIYYGNSREDAKKSGFDDAFIYDEIPLPLSERKIKMVQIGQKEALKVFEMWDANEEKIKY